DRTDRGLAGLIYINSIDILTDFCIGAENEVASVCLFSDVPLNNIETVLLDYQSKTSVNLAKVLFKFFWKKEVVFKAANEDFRNAINGTTAAVVIGDRAFEQRNQSKYVYDLAEAWIEYTNLPFVFAAWVANKPIHADFLDAFNLANAYGIKHLDAVVAENNYQLYNLKKYYSHNISYHLSDAKKQGLELFLEKVAKL
ncbi:MAG: menaquinone biosynthetic enzyme MqnA/MqnD family protein, partial [Chitinophagaceae bacterium]